MYFISGLLNYSKCQVLGNAFLVFLSENPEKLGYLKILAGFQ